MNLWRARPKIKLFIGLIGLLVLLVAGSIFRLTISADEVPQPRDCETTQPPILRVELITPTENLTLLPRGEEYEVVVTSNIPAKLTIYAILSSGEMEHRTSDEPVRVFILPVQVDEDITVYGQGQVAGQEIKSTERRVLRPTDKPVSPSPSVSPTATSSPSGHPFSLLPHAQAQADTTGCIYGQVTDKETKKPIPGIDVQLKNAGEDRALEETITDVNGGYYFLGLEKNKQYDVAFYSKNTLVSYIDTDAFVSNVAPTRRINYELLSTFSELSGHLYYRAINGDIKPYPSALTADKSVIFYKEDDKDYVEFADINQDGSFIFLKAERNIAYKLVVRDDIFFKDLSSQPHFAPKTNIQLIVERQYGKINVSASASIPGTHIDPIPIPNPPDLPALKFTLMLSDGDEGKTNQNIGLTEREFRPSNFLTAVPNIEISVPVGIYQIVYHRDNNMNYKVNPGDEIQIVAVITEPVTVKYIVEKKSSQRGQIIIRLLKDMENRPPMIPCEISRCRGWEKELVSKMNLNGAITMKTQIIPQKINDNYQFNISHEDMSSSIEGTTTTENLSPPQPLRAEGKQDVIARNNYSVEITAKADLCITIEKRVGQKKTTQYARLSGAIVKLGDIANVPANGEADIRRDQFPDASTVNIDISTATLVKPVSRITCFK